MVNLAFLADTRDPQHEGQPSGSETAPAIATRLGHDAASKPHPASLREAAPVPRIAIHAFCDSAELVGVVEAAAADRLMARAHLSLHRGGLGKAEGLYRKAPCPNLLIVESRSSAPAFLAELDRLAEVCDPGTRLLVIGHVNEVGFYRELLRRGVSEYLLAPISPPQLIAAVSRLYGDGVAAKLGKTYAFIGVKGGVGSSTIAHNVGWSIARRFQSAVTLVDMDLPFGTAGLNLNLEEAQGLREVLDKPDRVDEVFLERLLVQRGDHFNVLTAPATLDTPFDVEELGFEPVLELARAGTPHLVLDLPHLWTSWVRRTLVTADEIVITAVPDLANLRNAKNLVAFLRQARPHDAPPRLVLNQVGVERRPEIRPAAFAKALGIEPLVCIPFVPRVFGTAGNNGKMVGEVSARQGIAKTFAKIAVTMAGKPEPRRRSLLGSLLGRKSHDTGKR
ncbi:AAA family ATPase [Inquilinus sp. OTU3971]|uniref:AAA family ATPase n=1 Tax=Inquilinus sp. OTU3971 TaxID=3043855 RepID=UPI00313DBF58